MDKYTVQQLTAAFITYAEHHTTCQSWTHRHKKADKDKRVICTNSKCSCGLLDILQNLNPQVRYVEPCPDDGKPVRPLLRLVDTGMREPKVEPVTIFGIPVVEVSTD